MIHIFDIYDIFTVLIGQRYYHWIQVCIWSFTTSVIEVGNNENKEGLNISSQYNIKKATKKSHARNQHKF